MKPNAREQGKGQNQSKEKVLNAPLKTRLRAPLSPVRRDSRQSGGSFAQPITQYAKSGDIRIAYQVFGEGPVNVDCWYSADRSGFLGSTIKQG
jgi:hypothetical protein